MNNSLNNFNSNVVSETNDFLTPELLDIELNKTKRTRPKLTKYEKARVIGYRAQQIADGLEAFVDIVKLQHPTDIANEELIQKKLPYIIKRPIPDGTFEYWRINDLL